MKNKYRLIFSIGTLLMGMVITGQAQSTAFTYQGQLNELNAPADGVYDFEFALFPAAEGGVETNGPVQAGDVPVTNGIFSVAIDFGANAFGTPDRWLEIRVRDGASVGDYTVLSPRQPITATPVALHARSVAAGTIGSSEIAADSVGASEIVSTEVQRRISGACGMGFALQTVNEDGSVVCVAVSSASGDITAVTAGEGLTGGATSGVAELNVDFTAVQARLAAACGANQALSSITEEGQPVCVPISPIKGPAAVTLGLVGDRTSLAIGVDGNPVIGIQKSGISVVVCNDPNCRGGDETISVVDGNGNYSATAFPSLEIGGDGFPVMAYRRASGVWVAHCNDALCTGGDETLTEVVAGTGAIKPALAIGVDGMPVIAFNSGGEIWLVRCNDAACTGGNESINSHVTAAAASASGDVGVAVGSNDRPLIFYWKTSNNTVVLIACNDTQCLGQNEDERTVNGSVVQTLSMTRPITFASSGNPLVAESNGKLYRCTDASCGGIQQSSGTIRSNLAGAAGPDGHAAYLHMQDTRLLFTRCSDGLCENSLYDLTLDTQGSTINGLSLAFGADGNPVISYVEGGALRVYSCATPNCF